MKNMVEQEIVKLNSEIEALVHMRERLQKMLKEAPVADVAEPKKRTYTRKKKPGLPSAAPPASEANLL